MNKYDIEIVFENCESITIAKRNINIIQLKRVPCERKYDIQIEIKKDGDIDYYPFDISELKESVFYRITRSKDIVYLQFKNLLRRKYYVPWLTYKEENIYQESKILPNGNLFLSVKMIC